VHKSETEFGTHLLQKKDTTLVGRDLSLDVGYVIIQSASRTAAWEVTRSQESVSHIAFQEDAIVDYFHRANVETFLP
jgi:hypothetical protein